MNELKKITKVLAQIEENTSNITELKKYLTCLGSLEKYKITWPDPKDYYIYKNANPKDDWISFIEKLTVVTIKTIDENNFSDLSQEPFFKKIYTEYPFYINSIIQKIIKEECEALDSDDMDREESSNIFKEQLEQLIAINPNVLRAMKEKEQFNGFRKFLVRNELDYCKVLIELDMAYSISEEAERIQPLYSSDISDEAFVFLLEHTNFNFLKENKHIKPFSIWEGGEVKVIKEERQWVDIVCQNSFEMENQVHLERIDIIKNHSLFKNENWKVWDINTLNNSFFQDAIFDIQLNKDPEYLSSRVNCFEYLRQIREKYQSDLDNIILTHDFKEITLREYILKTENQTIITEMRIASEISPTKTIKLKRF